MKALTWVVLTLLSAAAFADEYAAATAALDAPRTQCRGAALLAQRSERRALVPLVNAYRRRGERGARCVLDAIMAVARSVDLVAGLPRAPDDEREATYEAMAHAPSPRFQATLQGAALEETSAKLRGAAYRALRTQGTSDAWPAVMRGLLSRAPTLVRAEMTQHLLDDLADPACRALLVWQAEREPDAALRAKIKARLGP